MSHFFIVPTDENGLIVDQHMVHNLSIALNAPFDYEDVFIYSHGWWTTATRAMHDYNRFSIEFSRMIGNLARTAPSPTFPKSSLGLGLHWPSMISEDTNSLLNWAQATSFYTMEKRADIVGQNAGYLLLRGLFENAQRPKRIHLLGHSFGCKVVLSLLQEIIADNVTVTIPTDVEINVVLLQAAFSDDDMEAKACYGDVISGFPNLKMLVTTSSEDLALRNAFPAAEGVNFFRSNTSRIALGFGGPTDAVISDFGMSACQPIRIGRDKEDIRAETAAAMSAGRLTVADLTQLHRLPDPAPVAPFQPDAFSGHHSDIFRDEIYELIAGFLFP